MERKTYAVYAITKHGLSTAKKLQECFPAADVYVSKKLFKMAPAGAKELPLPFSPMLKETFPSYDCHIFIISVGAVVRMIAPLLRNKKVDPAVLCVDDANRFTVCLLSGHVGRGNEFTKSVSVALGNQDVITTASDSIGTLTVDILGRELGWVLEDDHHNVTKGCAAVVNEEKVLFVQETGEPQFWPLNKDLPPGLEYCESIEGVDAQQFGMVLVASDRNIPLLYPELYENAIVYRPKSLVLGIGCDRDTPVDLLERGVVHFLKEFQLAIESVSSVATVSLKANEPGLVELCERYGWSLCAYEPEELDRVDGVLNPSEIVKKFIGTSTVAEGACLKNLMLLSCLFRSKSTLNPMLVKI